MFQVTDEAALKNIVDAYNVASALNATSPNTSNWEAVYKLIYDALSDFSLFGLGQTPKTGVDVGVYTWIEGARKVNRDSGTFATYIRNYTQRQYDLRKGSHEDVTPQIQKASNVIAQRFAATFLGFDLSGKPQEIKAAPEQIILNEIPPSLRGIVPPLEIVGRIDAAGAAADVFDKANSQAISGKFNNYSPWAGTVLFPNLGIGSFYQDWVLTNKPTDFKAEKGLYDLVAIAQATTELKTVYGGIKTLLTELPTYITTYSLGKDATDDLEIDANNFFIETYGSEFSSIKIGTDTFRDSAAFSPLTMYYKVGSVGDDLGDKAVRIGANTQVVNAGAGNDLIKIVEVPAGSTTPRVIDGGFKGENNTVDFSEIKTPLKISFEKVPNFDYRIIVKYTLASLNFTDYLYNINQINLSGGADKFAPDDATKKLLQDYKININFGGQKYDPTTTGSLPATGAGTDTIDTSALHGTSAGNTGLVIDLNTEDNQFIADIKGAIPTRLGLNGKFPTNFTEAAAVLGKVLSEVANPTDLSQYGKADRLNVKNVESAIGTDQSDLIIGADTVYTFKTPAADPNAPPNSSAPKPERVVDTDFRGYDLLGGGGNDTILVANDDLCEIKIAA